MRSRFVNTVILSATLLFATSALVFSLSSGCSTTQSQQVVNGLVKAGNAVDAAYLSYMQLVSAGTISTNSVAEVSKRYAEFKSVWSIAMALAALQPTAPPTPDLMNAESQVQLAIRAAKQAK